MFANKTCQFRWSTKYKTGEKQTSDYKNILPLVFGYLVLILIFQLFPLMLFLQWGCGAKSASWQLPRQSPAAALSQSHADQNPRGQVGLLRSTGGIPALLNSWWPSTTHLTPHLWADPETSNTSSGTLVRWHKTYFRTNTGLDWSTDKKGGVLGYRGEIQDQSAPGKQECTK